MDDEDRTEAGPARRTVLRRALLLAGGAAGVVTLAGCPNGSENDDENENDENGEGEDDD